MLMKIGLKRRAISCLEPFNLRRFMSTEGYFTLCSLKMHSWCGDFG